MHPSYPAVIPCYPITPTPNYHKNTPDFVHTPRTLKRPFDPLKICTLIFAASFSFAVLDRIVVQFLGP